MLNTWLLGLIVAIIFPLPGTTILYLMLSFVLGICYIVYSILKDL